jgi:hypothetical protein
MAIQAWMRWAEPVARMGAMKRSFSENLKRGDYLEDLGE